MKKMALILLTALTCYHSGSAQTIFTSQVIDQLTKEPLEAAVIEIKELNKNILTDKEGRFIIEACTEKINLFITSIGYQPIQVELKKQESLQIGL